MCAGQRELGDPCEVADLLVVPIGQQGLNSSHAMHTKAGNLKVGCMGELWTIARSGLDVNDAVLPGQVKVPSSVEISESVPLEFVPQVRADIASHHQWYGLVCLAVSRKASQQLVGV
jgi:hypothetical protein